MKVVRTSYESAKRKQDDSALEDYFRIKFDYIVKIRELLNNPANNIVLKQS